MCLAYTSFKFYKVSIMRMHNWALLVCERLNVRVASSKKIHMHTICMDLISIYIHPWDVQYCILDACNVYTRKTQWLLWKCSLITKAKKVRFLLDFQGDWNGIFHIRGNFIAARIHWMNRESSKCFYFQVMGTANKSLYSYYVRFIREKIMLCFALLQHFIWVTISLWIV